MNKNHVKTIMQFLVVLIKTSVKLLGAGGHIIHASDHLISKVDFLDFALWP